MRHTPFFTNGYYHLFNRGVDKRKIFLRFGYYLRFLKTVRSILNTGSATPRVISNQGLALKSKIHILAYCLMPNHYHFLIKQTQDEGVTEFMHRLNTSYTMYFNLNNKRTGRLFEYTFKAKTVSSDELLLHLSRYIHLNPVIAGIVEKPNEWRWSSYQEYFDIESHPICEINEILSYFSSRDDYKQFISDQISYAKILHEIEETKEKDEDSLFL